MTSWRQATSNQRWNNVVFVNVEIYNVEQRRINVVYFNVDINNFRQRRNKVVVFNLEFHSVDHCRNNVVNTTICKKMKRAKKNFEFQKFGEKKEKKKKIETEYTEL